MKQFLSRFTKKRIVLCLVGFISFLIFVGLTIYSNIRIEKLTDQHMAKRWSDKNGYSQISCFFGSSGRVTDYTLMEFKYKLTDLLRQDSIAADSEDARLFVDAYSAEGTVFVSSEKSSLSLNAIGVSGDFFMFHPLKLVNGTYFSSDYIMQDYVIIDEEAAWTLFGSSNVVGKTVMIRNVPHTVLGVVHRNQSELYKKAGLSKSTIYMSYNSLEKYGMSQGISTYEVVMPNPISGYAKDKVKDNIGVEDCEVVENTDRFSAKELFNKLQHFFDRSMRLNGVSYPYWENVARVTEDVLAIVFLFRIIFLGIPVVFITVLLIKLWRNRKWNIRDVGNGIVSLLYMVKGKIGKLLSKK